jgi:hypothetical protein
VSNYQFADLPMNLPAPLTSTVRLSPTSVAGISYTAENAQGQTFLTWVIDDKGVLSVNAPPIGTPSTPFQTAGAGTLYSGGISSDGSTIIATKGTQVFLVKNGVSEAIPSPQIMGSPYGVNNAGDWVATGLINGVYQGFLSQNGQITVLAVPGSSHGPTGQLITTGQSAPATSMNYTVPLAINNLGVIAGQYTDSFGNVHGFIYDHGGYQTIDAPGASYTAITGIDDQGNLTGIYTDASGRSSNFMAEDGHQPLLGSPITSPGGAAPHTFLISDQTTGIASEQDGTAYHGPVAGLTSEFISVTPDNVNITARTGNVFIHSGSGDDALNVSACGGNNVLDGSTGSNFLVGGSGNDTFYADARSPDANLWSTIVGFHAGDAATLWGITPQNFAQSMLDNMGADGYKGLTVQLSGASQNVSVTLAGFSTADLASGRLSVSYGSIAGSNYMQLVGH